MYKLCVSICPGISFGIISWPGISLRTVFWPGVTPTWSVAENSRVDFGSPRAWGRSPALRRVRAPSACRQLAMVLMNSHCTALPAGRGSVWVSGIQDCGCWDGEGL